MPWSKLARKRKFGQYIDEAMSNFEQILFVVAASLKQSPKAFLRQISSEDDFNEAFKPGGRFVIGTAAEWTLTRCSRRID